MLKTAKLLMADQRLAAVETDPARLVADYVAVAAIGRYAREIPILVNQFVAFGCITMADKQLIRLLHAKPALFARHEAELAHHMAQASRTLDIDFSSQKALLLDTIQRSYSDDGHGNGHLTPDGIQVLCALSGLASSDASNETLGMLLLPATAIVADRATLMSNVDRFDSAVQTAVATPYWLRRQQKIDAPDTLIREWRKSPGLDVLPRFIPSVENVVETSEKYREFHDAVMAAVAIQAFHREQGHYPVVLAELVPHYLPAVPLDMRTGGPLSYRLKDGQPILYGRGEDDQDHGGVWSDTRVPWPGIPRHGDWVFYPPPAEQ